MHVHSQEDHPSTGLIHHQTLRGRALGFLCCKSDACSSTVQQLNFYSASCQFPTHVSVCLLILFGSLAISLHRAYTSVKRKEVNLYSAFIVATTLQSAQAWITQFYLQSVAPLYCGPFFSLALSFFLYIVLFCVFSCTLIFIRRMVSLHDLVSLLLYGSRE